MIEIAAVESILTDIPFGDTISHVIPLEKGFSTDDKFIISVNTKPTYLLRISPAQETERRRMEFSLLTQLAACGVSCPKTYYFGEATRSKHCFSLLGYIPGICADEALPALDGTTQYTIGIKAGGILRQMHAVLEAPTCIDWPAYRGGKYRRTLGMAREHGLLFADQPVIEQYVSVCQHLMQGRPISFLHDDYHPGNMIVLADQSLGVIDFNRCDWGDPYHDFYKLAHFCAPQFPNFACGQVDGYFDGEPPTDFWPLYTLYVAMSLHSDIVWTQQLWPDYLNDSYQRIAQICETHDFTKGTAPTWYCP